MEYIFRIHNWAFPGILRFYRKVDETTVFSSPVSNDIDYTFFAGTPDDVISSYRVLTGGSPMMPLWALGYIHCRERFHSQQEILDVANRFRNDSLPVDMIVQDWQYWGKYGWNAMRFDEEYYPDSAALTDSLHAMDMKFMLSIWSKIDPASALGKKFGEKGYYIDNTQWVDFFNPEVAAFYWNNMRDSLVNRYDIDALWLDATEPENDDLRDRRVCGGRYPGEVFRNSMGGGASIVYGLSHPDMFAAVYSMSGYLRRQYMEFLKNDPSAEWRQQLVEDHNPIRRVSESVDEDIAS